MGYSNSVPNFQKEVNKEVKLLVLPLSRGSFLVPKLQFGNQKAAIRGNLVLTTLKIYQEEIQI
jgi:hypothetical protein